MSRVRKTPVRVRSIQKHLPGIFEGIPKTGGEMVSCSVTENWLVLTVVEFRK